MAIAPEWFDRHDRCGQPPSLAAVSLPSPNASAAAPALASASELESRPSQAPSLPGTAAGTMPATAAAGESLDPVLCQHCGRTAGNGISCIGMCVADSGY
jgi:hypothetical protein